MNTKGIITAVLLLFVSVSLLVVFLKSNNVSEPQTATSLSPKPEAQAGYIPEAKPEETRSTGIVDGDAVTVVYYFHGYRRCTTCKTIEALTRKTVESDFADGLKNGSVELRVVNIEEPGNEHFVDDYQLTTRTVVVSLQHDGTEKKWKRLDDVWLLVGKETEFIDYVRNEINSIQESKT